MWLDAAAWEMTALGMGFLAARVPRTSNDDWDLPAFRASPAPPLAALPATQPSGIEPDGNRAGIGSYRSQTGEE